MHLPIEVSVLPYRNSVRMVICSCPEKKTPPIYAVCFGYIHNDIQRLFSLFLFKSDSVKGSE